MSTQLPQLSLDRGATDRSSVADSFEIGSARRHGGKTLRPVLHNSRADVTSNNSNSQVRCFFSLAHKRCNPYESDFHMQARLGFKRPNRAAQIRLRPLDHPSLQPAPPSQQKNALEPPSPANRRRRRPGRKQPGELSLSPTPARGGGARSASPVMESFSRPITALVPEQGNVTWTTFEGMTRDTVGAVLSEALREDDAAEQVPLMEAAVAAAAASAEDDRVTVGGAVSPFEISAAPPAAETPASLPTIEQDAAAAASSAAELAPDVSVPRPKTPPPPRTQPQTPASKTPVLAAAPAAVSPELLVVKRVLTNAYQAAPKYLGVHAARRHDSDGSAWRHMPSVGTWTSLAPHGIGGSRW